MTVSSPFIDGEESRAFSPRAVSSFRFFDQKEQRVRQFYTLEAQDPENDLKKPLFFEVLKEYDNFAILSRVGRLHVDTRRRSDDLFETLVTPEDNSVTLAMMQVETVYIMNSRGELQPYMEIINSEDLRFNLFGSKKTKSRRLDKDLLQEVVTEPIFEKLKEFARLGNLSFRKKSDFLKILAYYDQIR